MTLSMNKLECHFTWRPDEDSTKANIEDVIVTTERKIRREPHKKNAYLATLAYLHTRKTRVDFVSAQKLLVEALKLDAQTQADKENHLRVSSEFVIRADLLHLKLMMSQRNKPPKREELEPEMQRLSSLWSDSNNRAQVFGVKGVTFDCFGPKKYEIGVKAFAEAKMLQPENFYWLYGEAFLTARCKRQSARKQADSNLLQLWSKARDIGELKGLTTAIFYANYAEAILHNDEYILLSSKRLHSSELCLQLVDKASELFLQSPNSFKEHSLFMYVVCIKIYRHLSWKKRAKAELDLTDFDQRRKDLLEDYKKTNIPISDSGFYLELGNSACECGDKEEAIRLLKKGQEVAVEPGNHWVELKLVELECETWEKDITVATFDSLRQTFSRYDRDVAVILFHKALYLMSQGDTGRAIDSCISAVEAQSSLEQVSYGKKNAFFKELLLKIAGNEEYLAWFAANFGTFKEQLDIECLFQLALSRDEHNEFALEHLGRFLMRNNKVDEATGCFRRLSFDHACRRELIAESVLKNPKIDLEMLQECLECGCRDAAPMILDILESRKLNQSFAKMVLAEVPSSVEAAIEPVFFRTCMYKLCAKIEFTIQDSNSFSLEKTETKSVAYLTESVKKRIADFLEISQLTSKSAPNQSGDRVSDDRGNLMRSSRLAMTKLNLNDAHRDTQGINNLIVSVMKESKEVLDRSLAVRLTGTGREFTYPHAFSQIKKQLGGDFKKNFNKLNSESERKTFELESLMKLLKENKDAASLEYVNISLREELKRIDPNFHQAKDTKDVFSFMAKREHRILSSEDSWIVRWIYLVNNEKHSSEILVNELNEQLRSDWSEGGECRRTAYDVAHLAGEFAEETWAVFSYCLGMSASAENRASAASASGTAGATAW